MGLLKLENLHVALEDGTEIVKGVDLEVDTNQVHAIMGPNGSGKSTLAYAVMGHPAYEVTEGKIFVDGVDVTEMGADERAQRGLFLAFQYPHAIPGVTVTSFLRSAINAVRKGRNGGVDDPIAIPEFRKELLGQMDRLKVSRELASRYLNDGFSGGEKKRVEILQMAMLKPRIAVLDETDSGLDIDALRVVATGVKELVGPEMGALVITHYQRILDYITPDFVHVFVGGKIVEEGGPELAKKLEAEGYAPYEGVLRNGADRDRGRPGDRLRLRDQVRLPRRRGLLLQVRPRPLARARRRDLLAQGRARLDAEVPAQEPGLLPRAPDADLGRERRRDRLREHLLLHQADREPGELLGGPARRHQGHLGQARHPRGGEEVPRRRRRAVRVGGRLPQAPGGSRQEGRHLPRHRHGAARARGSVPAVLRDDHPAERQQVRGAELGRLVGRLVHLRAAGREHRHAAPGVLPHQRGEHGPVRADADPRRRGRLRALRRGLHGADLLERLAAQRRRRDRRQEGRRAAATRRSRTGRTTSTTSSRSAPSPTRTRRWSGWTATSARS